MTLDIRSELTAAQLEIWLAQALYRDSAIYNVGETFMLPRTLDRQHFSAALAQAVAETEALHVRFARTDRGPAQRRRQPPNWRLEERTIGGAPDALQSALHEEVSRPIDVEGEALFRATLFDCAEGLVWCQIYHHIVMDGFGRYLFARRVAEIYTSLTDECEPPARGFGSFDELRQLRIEPIRQSIDRERAHAVWGQRQRLSIARAVARDPRIAFFDEPAAFLDAEAAVALERRLAQWGRERLLMLVSHHLAATQDADLIVVLEQGRVAGCGRHDDLLASTPVYASLWHDYNRKRQRLGAFGA